MYVGNNGDATVSVFSAATCNATKTLGCPHAAARLDVPGGPSGLAINEATHTLFVSDNSTAAGGLGPGNSPVRADSVAIVNAATCRARDTSGCHVQATAFTGAAPGAGVVDATTNTLFVVTGDNALSVVNGATCNGRVRTGCGQPPSAAIAGPAPFPAVAAPTVHTLYVGNFGDATISMIDTATCNTVRSLGSR